MTEFKVGNFVEVDKESPKWKTKEGNFIVISAVNANADPKLSSLNLLVASCQADAEALSKYLTLEDMQKSIPSGVKRTYDNILRTALVTPPLVNVPRGSWHWISTNWRDLYKDSEARTTEEDTTPPEYVGEVLDQIAVISGGEPIIITNVIVTKLNADGSYTVRTQPDNGQGVEYEAKKEAIAAVVTTRSRPAPDAIDASSLSAEVLLILKRLSLSNACKQSNHISKSDARAVVSGAGMDASRDPEDTESDYVAHLLRSLKRAFAHAAAGSADFSDKDVIWSTNPTRLGSELRSAIGDPKPIDVGGAGGGSSAFSHPKAGDSGSKFPLSEAFQKLAVDQPEFQKFLQASVNTTVPNEAKRAETKDSLVRSRAALERTLVQHGSTLAAICMLAPPASMSSDELMVHLDSLEASPVQQPGGWDASKYQPAPGARPHGPKGDGLDVDIKLSVITAAAAVINNKASFARLTTYIAAVDNGNAYEAQKLLNDETDADVLRLLGSHVESIQTVLEGTVAPEVTRSVMRVRKALDKRIERFVLGKEKEATALESAQIRRAHRGQVRKLNLLELVDVSNSGFSQEKPLHGFAGRGARAETDFMLACNRWSSIIQCAQPHAASDALDFFRAMTSRVAECLSRGASWQVLSTWFASVTKRMTEDAAQFAAGAHDVKLMALNLDTEIIESHTTPHARKLEQDIADARFEAYSSSKKRALPDPGSHTGGDKRTRRGTRKPAKKKNKPNGKPKPAAGADDDTEEDGEVSSGKDDDAPPDGPSTEKWGTFLPDKWGDKTKALFDKALKAKGLEKGTGKLPCGFWYNGECKCKGGKTCSFWHFTK